MKKLEKLESLNKSKFDKFESKRIALSINVFGGASIKSGKDANGCVDTFNYTKRKLSSGHTYNDRDNVRWDCPDDNRDTIPSIRSVVRPF